ncbi:MAG: glycosyltransferase family 9 protein [Bacteroidota bacterium]
MNPRPNDVKKILLIRTDRIGDVVLSLPMLPVLKKNFPAAEISVMVRNYTRDIVARHSCVAEIIRWEQNGERSVSFYVDLLKQKRFDIVIIPYPRFLLALIVFLARIPVRVGTGYRWYSFLFNAKVYEHRKDALRHEAEYNLNLLKAIGIEDTGTPEFELPIPDDVQKKIDAQLAADAVGRFAVLHPGSGGSARDWPAENFAGLGDALHSEEKLTVILTGGAHEQAVTSAVIKKMKSAPLDYTGKFSLQELGALYKRAVLFVSNSTGPLHIASAVGTPVVAFYPPIVQCSAVRWGPYTQRKRVFTADAGQCPLCHGGTCRSNVCMEQITVEQVVTGIGELLHEHP